MPHSNQDKMHGLTSDLKTKSDKIRRLAQEGYRQADVARFLEISDQHVSSVLRSDRLKKVHGFKESADTPEFGARETSSRLLLKVDGAGRVLLPAHVRQAMGIDSDGDELMANLRDGELSLLTPAMAIEKAQRLVRELIPGDDSLAGQLIADRRQEALAELDDG